MRNALVIVSSFLLLVAAAPKRDWKDVEQALGRAGTLLPGDVYKVSFPRSDLTVMLDGVTIKPALALGSWAAFKEIGGGHVMAMGDLVLLESEVTPVMDALQKGGIEQSALHNHLIGESPHVMYMHFDAVLDDLLRARHGELVCAAGDFSGDADDAVEVRGGEID